MTQIFLREIERLHRHIQHLGEVIEGAVRDGIRAVETRDTELAQRVIAGDQRVDEMEVEIEEECLKILTLHQPVANDLRFIVAVLKMNNDLERIGDKAAGLGKKAIKLAAEERATAEVDHHGMADKALSMLSDSLSSLISRDRELAQAVCERDDEINALEEEHTSQLRNNAMKHPQQTKACGLLIEVSSALERVADLATNIAEDVIYMIDGTIIRHRRNEMDS
jgi:phosphate transport system protein